MRGNTITSYNINWDGQYLINFHNGYTKADNSKVPALKPNDYPSVTSHIDSIALEVENGIRTTRGGHKGANKGFYERTDCGNTAYNLRPCKYIECFDFPKIVWKQTSSNQTFAFDDNGYYLDVSGQFMYSKSLNTKGLLYLLSVLNSKLSYYWFYNSAVKFGSQGVRWIPAIIEQFPIPKNINQQLVDLVDNRLKTNDSSIDNQIDTLVYEMYGLTEEEIKVVEIR